MAESQTKKSTDTPAWARAVLSSTDINAIEAAIKAAEKKTSAEIVLVLVKRCDFYQSGALAIVALFCFLALALLLSLNTFRPFADVHTHTVASFGISVCCLLVAGLLIRFDRIKRYFISSIDVESSTTQRAELEFHRQGIRETRAKTGVLVFISMYERRVIVLADKAINDRLPDSSTWTEMVAAVINGINSKQFAKGLISAVDIASDVLAKHFPGDHSDNPNELSDRLVIYPD